MQFMNRYGQAAGEVRVPSAPRAGVEVERRTRVDRVQLQATRDKESASEAAAMEKAQVQGDL